MNFPDHASFFCYRPASLLHVTGSDAAEFLQGQFTNDLAKIAEGEAAYGLWLDRKGRVAADSFVVRRGSGYWLASYGSQPPALRKRLEDYIVADDVTVEDLTPGWAAVALLGEGTGAWVRQAAGEGFAFPGRRASAECWEWVYPESAAAAVETSLPAGRGLSAEEIDRLRIEAGLPMVPVDIGPEDLPNEGGLEAAAISYSKGCYLGQEVIARLKSKGRIRRKLCRVEARGPLPGLPAPLWQGGRRVGELRSAAPDRAGGGHVGLAMLALPPLRADGPLAFAAEGGPAVRPA